MIQRRGKTPPQSEGKNLGSISGGGAMCSCSPRKEEESWLWGFYPAAIPQPLACTQMPMSTNPPKDLMSFQTAIVLTNLIETSQGVQGLGGEGRTDRATPETPSGWKSK